MKRTAQIALTLLALPLLWHASARGGDSLALLRNLSSGTKLVARHAVVIRANEDSAWLGGASGTSCYLRVRESRPFDRLIRPDQALTVSGTRRVGFSYRRAAAVTTYVKLDSKAVEDIMCRSSTPSGETTLSEFSRAVGGSFSIASAPAPQPIE